MFSAKTFKGTKAKKLKTHVLNIEIYTKLICHNYCMVRIGIIRGRKQICTHFGKVGDFMELLAVKL